LTHFSVLIFFEIIYKICGLCTAPNSKCLEIFVNFVFDFYEMQQNLWSFVKRSCGNYPKRAVVLSPSWSLRRRRVRSRTFPSRALPRCTLPSRGPSP